MNLSLLFKTLHDTLTECGIEDAKTDILLILNHVTGVEKARLVADIYANTNISLTDTEEKNVNRLIALRKKHMPISYILGYKHFMDLQFYVDKNVLIPRPETEFLVTNTLKYIKKYDYKKGLEIGTGSGIISVCLCHYSNVVMTATDISKSALEISKKNAKVHDVLEKINFVQSDVFDNYDNEKVDFIISNPPYIKTADMESLMIDVKDYEPHLALDGMEDGLYFYKKIIQDGKKYLKPKGMMFFEIGYNQGNELTKLFTQNGFININIIKDYEHNDRVAYAAMKYNEV